MTRCLSLSPGDFRCLYHADPPESIQPTPSYPARCFFPGKTVEDPRKFWPACHKKLQAPSIMLSIFPLPQRQSWKVGFILKQIEVDCLFTFTESQPFEITNVYLSMLEMHPSTHSKKCSFCLQSEEKYPDLWMATSEAPDLDASSVNVSGTKPFRCFFERGQFNAQLPSDRSEKPSADPSASSSQIFLPKPFLETHWLQFPGCSESVKDKLMHISDTSTCLSRTSRE